jgi:hypothetical protein
MIDKG